MGLSGMTRSTGNICILLYDEALEYKFIIIVFVLGRLENICSLP